MGDPDLHIRERGTVPKFFLRLFVPQFGVKIRRGHPQAPPLDKYFLVISQLGFSLLSERRFLLVESFPKMILFCECNSVRIGQNIQNEVSVKISIFADIVVYQLI